MLLKDASFVALADGEFLDPSIAADCNAVLEVVQIEEPTFKSSLGGVEFGPPPI